MKLGSGRKRELFWSHAIQAIFERRAVSAFPAALTLSSLSLLALSYSSHLFTLYDVKIEQILLCLLCPCKGLPTKQIGRGRQWIESACFFMCLFIYISMAGGAAFPYLCEHICRILSIFADKVPSSSANPEACLLVCTVSGDYRCCFAETDSLFHKLFLSKTAIDVFTKKLSSHSV